MQVLGGWPGRSRSTAARQGRRAAVAARAGPGRTMAGLVTAATAVSCLGGCTRPVPAAAQPIQLSNAWMVQPAAGSGPVYMVIENAGPADRLIGASSSAGGRVILLGAARTGPAAAGSGPAGLDSLRAIAIPARTLVRLTPASDHLLITGSRRLRSGTQVTVTLLFRHAGAVRIAATVTNPQTGGGSYLGD